MTAKLDESIKSIEEAEKNLAKMQDKLKEEKENGEKLSKALKEQIEVTKTLQNEIKQLREQEEKRASEAAQYVLTSQNSPTFSEAKYNITKLRLDRHQKNWSSNENLLQSHSHNQSKSLVPIPGKINELATGKHGSSQKTNIVNISS